MAIIAFGIAALAGTVILAAYGSESWLCFWDTLAQAARQA